MARSNAWGAVDARWPRVGSARPDSQPLLSGPEAMVTALLRGPLRLDDQLGWERRGADEPHLALADQVGQRGQGLPDVRAVVGPVHLVEVDVAGAEPPQAVLH